MKFYCDRNILSEALTNVSKAVADRSAISSLEGIKFSIRDNILELTGYDLEIGIRTSFSVKSEYTGSFIVNPRLFSDMVRKMPDGEISVDIDDNYFITIEGGNARFNLNSVPADDYPELPSKEDFEPISISQPVLKSMIVQTKFAASQLDLKPILKGELFTIEDNMLSVAAIDGFRLAVRTEPISYSENIKFIVPAKNLDEVAKLLSDNDEDECRMFLTKKHIIFEIGSYVVNSRLLEGEFHPYKSSIPVSHNTEVIVDRSSLITSLERCMLLINEKNPSPVRCRFEDNAIKLKCQTGAIGKVQDEIDIEMSGSSVEIGFKCRFFLDPLKAVSDEKVKLQLSNPLQPMKITPIDSEKYIYLVLPVRLPKE